MTPHLQQLCLQFFKLLLQLLALSNQSLALLWRQIALHSGLAI